MLVKRKIAVSFLFMYCFLQYAWCQSLLPNGNFEMRTGNPTRWGQAYLLKYWKGVAHGKWSPVTYFFEFEDIGYVPLWREGGTQRPFSGHGFVGLGIAIRKTQKKGSQYLEVKLLKPLQKDSLYLITAFVSLADKMHCAVDYIPAALSQNEILPVDGKPLYLKDYIKLRADTKYLDDTKGWLKVSATYKAQGGENHFIIGGITGSEKADQGYKIKVMPFKLSPQYLLLRNLTYYFIDNISVQKLFPDYHKTDTIAKAVVDSVIPEKQVIVLNDVIFEFNSHRLKDTSDNQWDSVISKLKSCKKCHFIIKGYTDNIGSKTFNYDLSERRAKTVCEFLASKGIPLEKMTYLGLGENNPVETNDSSEGRIKNRRVEIIIE
jgi:outer membrane protein OmpA-like peptidoglycan-associated protein